MSKEENLDKLKLEYYLAKDAQKQNEKERYIWGWSLFAGFWISLLFLPLFIIYIPICLYWKFIWEPAQDEKRNEENKIAYGLGEKLKKDYRWPE
tara:strand:+ start:276 stop:557 length:282 start_codon:yes stop_codon:yes gene_type:complete